MGGGLVVLIVIVVLALGGIMWWQRFGRGRREQELADARADAQRWYDRLGGQVLNLTPTDDQAVKQNLFDASERYNSAGSQMEQATTPRQFALAKDTALEGLHYVNAARTGMGLDPGPELPPTEAQRQAGRITEEREATVEGQTLKASPRYGADTPYYYPGGRMQGRNVPAGYYSQPWWKQALSTGAGVFGGMLLFDALFSPGMGFGGGFDGGYDNGFDQGYDSGFDQGYDQGMDAGDGGDGGDFDGGDFDGGGFDGGDFF
ncbi:MAG TPA: hypothetical protein VHC49_13715 [Mycobacteriales bacterium]|nr:hypothetical protein [Mycobacteriales bacterium]